MNETLEKLVAAVQQRFGENITNVTEFRDDVIITVSRDAIVDLVRYLRDNTECPFPLCEDVFGIDQFKRKQRFEVNYHFFSLTKKVRIHLKVQIEENDATVPSITSVFPGAEWHERETYDMYGITFFGNKDLRRIYMPENFEYYPLRKDFPLMGIPGSIPLPGRG